MEIINFKQHSKFASRISDLESRFSVLGFRFQNPDPGLALVKGIKSKGAPGGFKKLFCISDDGVALDDFLNRV